MTRTTSRTQWFRGYFGWDRFRRRGLLLGLAFICHPEMVAEGELIPCGLIIEVRTEPFSIRIASDADLIATKLATG